jgi:transglutaminase-like putative cysteine protease
LFGRGDSIRLEWNALDRGPFAIEQSLMRAPMREGEQRRLRYFDPLLGRPIDAQLTAYDYFDTPTFTGQKERLLEIQITSNAQDDVASSQIWADPQGRIHKRYSPSLDLKSFRCDQESARVAVDQSELADLPLRSIPIFNPSATAGAKGPQRYRVESIQPGYSLLIPSRTHQVVRSIKNRRLEVTVYPASDLGNTIEGIEQEPNPPPESLANSVVIDANQAEIQRMADQLLLANNASKDDPPERRARWFAQGIASRVQAIPFDRRVSSGRATLAAGKGDCFDLAALLAGLCRSNGISARIAIGLRCDPQTQPLVMNLHAWTEIHDGTRWIPFDASLPDPEVSADRIKWVDTLWNSINPYESILQLARQLSTLEVAVTRGGP